MEYLIEYFKSYGFDVVDSECSDKIMKRASWRVKISESPITFKASVVVFWGIHRIAYVEDHDLAEIVEKLNVFDF